MVKSELVNNVFERLSLKWIIRKDIKTFGNWKDTIIRNFEDTSQQVELLKIEGLNSIKERILKKKLKVTRNEKVYLIEDINELEFIELFTLIYRRVKPYLLRYLQSYYSSINNLVNNDNLIEDEDGETVSLIERIEDKQSQLEFSNIEMLELLKASLTAKQYEFIMKYIETNKVPNRDVKMQQRIRERIKNALYEEKEELKNNLYDIENYNRQTIQSISHKLYKIANI